MTTTPGTLGDGGKAETEPTQAEVDAEVQGFLLEPWTAARYILRIFDDKGKKLESVHFYTRSLTTEHDTAIVRRIVAAWAALATFTTEEIESGQFVLATEAVTEESEKTQQ